MAFERLALIRLGFAELDMKEHFGWQIPNCEYLYRVCEGQHQYVSLVHYCGVFCEAVCEVFTTSRNVKRTKTKCTREAQEKGLEKLHCTLYRDIDSLVAAISRVYPLATCPVKPKCNHN